MLRRGRWKGYLGGSARGGRRDDINGIRGTRGVRWARNVIGFRI